MKKIVWNPKVILRRLSDETLWVPWHDGAFGFGFSFRRIVPVPFRWLPGIDRWEIDFDNAWRFRHPIGEDRFDWVRRQ